jgi:hypothetical protein
MSKDEPFSPLAERLAALEAMRRGGISGTAAEGHAAIAALLFAETASQGQAIYCLSGKRYQQLARV